MIEIPLQAGAANAHQTFSMLLGENLLEFTLNYITIAGPSWSLDVRQNDQILMVGAMLEPNTEITSVYSLDIGKLYFVGKDVTLDNLGRDNALVWVP